MYMNPTTEQVPSSLPADAFSGGAAFVDGQIVPLSEARISMLDWGFLHSDATYDVAHVWHGSFFRLDAHLDRFLHGMQRLRMVIPYDRVAIQAILVQCVRASGLHDAYVEMICTRGVPPPGSRDPRQCVNRFHAFVVPFVWIADAEQRNRGLRVHVSSTRRIAPESVDPRVKNYHWLDLVKGLFEAYDDGQETTVLTDGLGNVVEGPGFNVFALVDRTLITPAHGALEGITRRTAVEIAVELGLDVRECELSRETFTGADEAFLTSTAGGILPVGWIDGAPIGRNGAGPVTRCIAERYWAAHDDPRYRLSVFSDS